MWSRLLLLSLVIAFSPQNTAAEGEGGVIASESSNKIKVIRQQTERALHQLYSRWKITEFPNFLRSVAMSPTSWEVLKVKYQLKILKAMSDGSTEKKNKEKFVISFMGSSVTAGHDTKFNLSVSELTREVMMPAFKAAGIELKVINGAMGNNPCLPYDACVRTFAGPEADIVHWEQSYNCFGTDGNKRVEFEQFIRQSMALPSQPVVVFTTSSTPNWRADDCKGKNPEDKPVIKDADERLVRLLDTDPSKIPQENKREESHWSALLTMFQQYKMAGIQMWHHEHYQEYKCKGPYVKDWGCCSASWHPSKLGHELRAAHYSYFWLLIFKDAVNSVEKLIVSEGTVATALQKVQKHFTHEHKHMPSTALNPSKFSDGLRCLTTYEPRADPESHLNDYVIASDDNKWESEMLEMLMEKHAVAKAKTNGYKDFKHMLYGNKNSGPLSIKITLKKKGTVFLCQPPGVWGKMPGGFKWFWDADTKVYLTENIPADTTTRKKGAEERGTKFTFALEKAAYMPYTNHKPKDTQNVCVDFNAEFPVGTHALTIIPQTEDKIMISTVLIP